jgi:hypothetical protein
MAVVLPWRLFSKPRRTIRKVFVHCSDSDRPEHDDVSVIRDWHLARGFTNTGYHYFIRKDGMIQIGRPIEKIPAAQAGHNTGSIAICLSGRTDFTVAQFNSLRTLSNLILGALPDVTFWGHHDVDRNKTCPNFNVRKELGLDKYGKVIGTTKP